MPKGMPTPSPTLDPVDMPCDPALEVLVGSWDVGTAEGVVKAG